MIVLFASQKGGVGKSTAAVHTAAAAAQAGRRVALVDADPQGSAAWWHGEREAAQISPSIDLHQVLGQVQDRLYELDDQYDLVVVDVAGRDSEELRSAVTAAGIVVAVFQPEQFDLNTAEHFVSILDRARQSDLNPSLRVHALISRASTHPWSTSVKDARAYLAYYPTLPQLDTVIYDRKAYRDAIVEGLGVTESSNRKAKREFDAFINELEILS